MARDVNRCTPLHLAVANAHLNAVAALLDEAKRVDRLHVALTAKSVDGVSPYLLGVRALHKAELAQDVQRAQALAKVTTGKH